MGAVSAITLFHVSALAAISGVLAGLCRWTVRSSSVGAFRRVENVPEHKPDEALHLAEQHALELVAKGTALKDVLTFICRTIESYTAPMLCSVMRVSEDRTCLQFEAGPSLPEEYTRMVDGIPIGPTAGSCGRAAYSGILTVVEDSGVYPLCEDCAHAVLPHGLRACWSQPIMGSTGRVLGTFVVYSREPCTPRPSELRLIERAGHIAGIAIEHAEMTEALRESESRFQAFMNHSPAVTFIRDESGHHVYVNSKFEELFGVSKEDVRGKTVHDFMPTETAERLHRNDQRVFSTGQTLEVEETIPDPNGIVRHWLVIKFPLDVSRKRLIGGVAIDITARKQMETVLRESEERFRVIADTAPALIWMTGNDKQCTYVNSRWLEYTGRPMEQEVGDGWARGVHPHDRDRCWTLYSEAFERRESFEMEYRLRKADEQYGWIQDHGVPRFLPDGTFAGYLGACIDITERERVKDNLRRTQFAMDQAVDAVYWIDPQARILYTNAAASVMLGYTADEFLRMTVQDLNPEFSSEVWPGWWAETREKEVVSLETVHLTKDGRRIPVDLRVSFLAYGGLEFHCAFVRDISERKRADEVLRGTQERFELAVRGTNDGIWDWNIVTGALYWSARSFELLGLQSGELTPSYDGWMSMIHPDDADRAHQAVRLHLETREPYDIELRVRIKGSRYRWFRDQGQAVWDAEGRPTRMVGSISDVTKRRVAEEELRTAHAQLEQRVMERTAQLALANRSLQNDIAERTRAEEALRASELRYKLLTEATFDGIAIHDHGVLLEVNPGLERMYGYGPGELIGRSILDLVAEESRPMVLANMCAGVTGPYEAVGRRKDGTTFPGEVVVRPYQYGGKEVRLVAGRDITERKHLEAERLRHTQELEQQVEERTAEIAKLQAQRVRSEKLAAVGQLAAGVAHEINNPIAGIKNAFLLVKQAINPAHPHYEFVGMIDREIARVGAIVQNMYQLYRKEARKPEAIDLQVLICDLEGVFAKRMSQRGVRFLVDLPPSAITLYVSQGDLLQVLMNLIRNAIDSMRQEGTIRLTVSQADCHVKIAVTDTGVGISPDVLPHIFDPFFTTKSETDQKGMGLGLSVSQSLVTAMGGTIEVETQYNRGSTFAIVLPRQTAIVIRQMPMTSMKEVELHDS